VRASNHFPIGGGAQGQIGTGFSVYGCISGCSISQQARGKDHFDGLLVSWYVLTGWVEKCFSHSAVAIYLYSQILKMRL
jgi:hypothetical protein